MEKDFVFVTVLFAFFGTVQTFNQKWNLLAILTVTVDDQRWTLNGEHWKVDVQGR